MYSVAILLGIAAGLVAYLLWAMERDHQAELTAMRWVQYQRARRREEQEREDAEHEALTGWRRR